MPARTRGWTKTADKPNEQTFESRPYRIEVLPAVDPVDMAEAEKRLDHARQQIDLTKRYPGRR